MNDVEALLAKLRQSQSVSILGIAVYPRGETNTGLLEEQGGFLQEVVEWLRTEMPSVEAFRTMWSQLVLVFTANPAQVSQVIQTLASMTPSVIESRAVSVQVEAGRELAVIDDLADELSSRRNFGTVLPRANRYVDGQPWVSKDQHPVG
jgi:hypothetical protein